nr:flagellar filament capping protein FliD [Vallitaleaceae bacterium]
DTAEEKTFMAAMGFTVDGTNSIHEDAIPALGSKGQEANYTYNGLALTSSSNSISINGMSLTLNGETASDITVNVTQDTDAIYNKVKSFLTAYNELIEDINTKIDADYNNEYEPLTDTEKEALDDTTIELWETKIKDSLLRRDDTLSSLVSSMRSILTSSSGVATEVGGYKYISELGIVTGDYTEKGQLHIQGNTDDSLYALREDKLRTAIEEDSDKVADLMNAIGDELSSMMNDKMKSTTLSSALTFYID